MDIVEAGPADSVDITDVNVEIDFALTPEEQGKLKAEMDEIYWRNWKPGQGLRFFRQ